MEPLRRDAARNRARIVEAARTIADRGDPLALNAVAKAAGVGVATVYRHFATVEELEEALVSERFDELAVILRESQPAQVERALTALFELMIGDPLFEAVTARPTPALETTATRRQALTDELDALMEQSRRQGSLRTDLDATGAILLICGLAHAVRAAGASAGTPTAHTLLKVLLDGISAPRANV